MITIQSAMLLVLGFLAATLLALLLAPAFWSRAVRLTSRRIKDTMPLSEIEIRADKDRIRAEYAIKVHKLESQVEQVRLAAARQQIEINRRDATVNELEGQLERLKANHEETQNARRVLEQTVADRLPRVEQRLNDAKKLLLTRDNEIGELTRTANRQSSALGEATAINGQRQAEIERLTTSLATRAARNQEGPSDARFDGEVALRGEIEGLRAKTREQAQLLARLQSFAGRPGAMLQADAGANGATAAGAGGAIAGSPSPEIERLLRAAKSRGEDQAAEIARLKAALAVFENEDDPDSRMSLRDSRIGLKARLQSLEAQTVQQSDTIQKLRSEIAAANERLARQANHFTNELRRLGSGVSAATGPARRGAEPQRLSLADRVAQARTGPPDEATATAAAGAEVARLAGKSNGKDAAGAAETTVQQPAAPANGAAKEPQSPAAAVAGASSEERAKGKAPEAAPRTRLLDRISNLARTP